MYEYFGFALQMVNLHDLGSRTKLNKSKTLGAILEKCQKWPNCMKWVVLIKWTITGMYKIHENDGTWNIEIMKWKWSIKLHEYVSGFVGPNYYDHNILRISYEKL